MAACESVSKGEDGRRLSPERGEEESHQLDSSSSMEPGEDGYSSPMDVSEFDSVARIVLGELAVPSRTDKETGSSSSRAEVKDVNFGIFSVAENADSVAGWETEVLNFVFPSVVEKVGSFSRSVVKEVDSASGSEVGEVDSASGSEVGSASRSEVEEVDCASGSEEGDGARLASDGAASIW